MSHGWILVSAGRATWWVSRMNCGMVRSSGMWGMGPPSAWISAMVWASVTCAVARFVG